MSRRKMMLCSAIAVASLSLASLATRCWAGSSEISQGKSLHQRFKIGACDWSLGKASDPASFEMARRIGLDGVQVSMGSVENDLHLRRPDVQKQFLKAAKENGMEIASLCILNLNSVPYKSDPRTVRWVSDSIDVCKAMQVPIVMLPFFGKGDLRNDKKGLDVVVERLKGVAPKAEKAGVVIGLESWLSAEQNMDIINRVGSPAVKVYYDVGNSHKRGYDIYKEIRSLGAENLCEFHAKDYGNLFGEGKVDFKKVRLAMDDAGYRGWIQIEGAKPLGLEASYRHNAKYLRSIFQPELIYLIGDDFSAWRQNTGTWQIVGEAIMDPENEKLIAAGPGSGVIVNGPKGKTVNLFSRKHFGDVRAHIEFMIPRKSNSGVYFMGRYEIQIYDSWGVKKSEYPGIECGGIYQRWDKNRTPKGFEGHSPLVNATLPPGKWQSFDVIFRAPRFDKSGKKITNARFKKVIHNGVVVHKNIELTGPTRSAAYSDEKPTGPLMLQGNHGPVAYRNIRVTPLACEE